MTEEQQGSKGVALARRWLGRAGFLVLVVVIALVAAFLTAAVIDLAARVL